MNPHEYKVPPFTHGEIVTMRFSLKEIICRWLTWRKDPVWRENIREAIAAYRKLQQSEVA
jgi:hypothetical protein